jgi:hypothetical protein
MFNDKTTLTILLALATVCFSSAVAKNEAVKNLPLINTEGGASADDITTNPNILQPEY